MTDEPNVDWQTIGSAPAGKVVWTKIQDATGVRNVQKMLRRGNLWWLSDGSMYVYYTPTHWTKP